MAEGSEDVFMSDCDCNSTDEIQRHELIRPNIELMSSQKLKQYSQIKDLEARIENRICPTNSRRKRERWPR